MAAGLGRRQSAPGAALPVGYLDHGRELGDRVGVVRRLRDRLGQPPRLAVGRGYQGGIVPG